jgi:hypothetical protein
VPALIDGLLGQAEPIRYVALGFCLEEKVSNELVFFYGQLV